MTALSSVYGSLTVTGCSFDVEPTDVAVLSAVWYNEHEQESSVDSSISSESMNYLIDFLNGKELQFVGQHNIEELIDIAIEWGCDEFLAGVVKQCVGSGQLISIIHKSQEHGIDTSDIEEHFRQSLDGGDFEGVVECPAEIILRVGARLTRKRRIGVAKVVKGFVGKTLIEGVTGLIEQRVLIFE